MISKALYWESVNDKGDQLHRFRDNFDNFMIILWKQVIDCVYELLEFDK